jgi:hypothetical protein
MSWTERRRMCIDDGGFNDGSDAGGVRCWSWPGGCMEFRARARVLSFCFLLFWPDPPSYLLFIFILSSSLRERLGMAGITIWWDGCEFDFELWWW